MSTSSWRRCVAAAVGGVLAVTLTGPAGAAARRPPAEPKPVRWSTPQNVKSVDVRNVVGRTAKPITPRSSQGTPKVAWPSTGAAEAAVSGSGAQMRAGALPVFVQAPAVVGAATAAAAPERVRVEVLDRAATVKAGVDGLVLKVRRVDGKAIAGPVDVSVDYSSFRDAYGGDWATRLRIIPLGGAPQPGPVRNDLQTGRLSAQLQASSVDGSFAVMAVAEGAAGDYAATSLSPESSWQVSTSSGAFTWSYPMKVPPVPGGMVPELSAAYSSQSVDGRVVSRNNQPSWLGEGWSLGAGFIERSYKACADDTGSGANNTVKTGDLCWETQNASISFGEQSGRLVSVDSDGDSWRLQDDDGTRIERKTGAINGDDNGEYWVVTTTDGTQYHFGQNRLPGWMSGKATTNSAWTVPVYANEASDPSGTGYVAGNFAGSSRTQAYRWNLDYVVDPHGNAMTYYYETATNKYAANGGQATVPYVRDGWLSRIEYGLRDGKLFDPPPAKVVFTEADRCKAGATCTRANTSAWPDVPWDLECQATSCGTKHSPTFWSSKRLASVTTQVADTPVDRWDLTQSFPVPGDGTKEALWLDQIRHTGLGGADVADDIEMAPVRFGGHLFANRVNTTGDGIPPLNKMRINAIYNESGGVINVNYAPTNCSGEAPAVPATNTLRCFPVRWAMPEATEPKDDWFHKYVVIQTVEDDNTLKSAAAGGVSGASKDVVTNYDYRGDAAWAFDDNPLTPETKRTWSQWRGYEKVVVTKGDPVNDENKPKSKTQYQYFRGMYGDKAATGTKTDTIKDSTGTEIKDLKPLAGFLREVITFDGDTAVEVDGEIHTPQAQQTAAQGSFTAFQVENVSTVSRTRLATGSYRKVRIDTVYDGYGNPTKVTDHGDLGITGDETCTTTTYAQNATKWIMDLPKTVQEVGVLCGGTPSYPDDALSFERIYYDGQALNAAPTKGNATKTEAAQSYSGNVPEAWLTTATTGYDTFGRVISTRDAIERESTTEYTETNGLTTSTKIVQPLGHKDDDSPEAEQLRHVSTTTVDQTRGLPVKVVDVAGRTTSSTYDALGRLIKVWQPGRTEAAGQTPHLRYTYGVLNSGGPSWIQAETMMANGNHVSSFQLLDGFLRPRQTQAPSPSGGRLITDTWYDSRGLVSVTTAPYHNTTAPPSNTLVVPAAGAVPASTVTVYDGAERETDSIYLHYNAEQWRTRTYHGGDHTSVVPPSGGTATTTYTDAQGRTTRLLQYKNRPAAGAPTGTADTTRYGYDKAGALTSITDAANNVWKYTYDVLGRKTSAVDPDKGTTTMTYDNAGQLVTTTDARGKTITSVYDGLGRVTEKWLGPAITGTLLTKSEFDTLARGSLTSSTRYVNGANGHAYIKKVIGYDEAGRPTGDQVIIPDVAGAPDQALKGTYTTTVEYTAGGSLKKTNLPMLGDLWGESLSYTYTALGQRNSATGLLTYIDETLYNKYGDVSQVHLRKPEDTGKRLAVTPYYEESTRRLARSLTETDRDGATLANDIGYTYDPAGNVLSKTDVTPGQATDTQCFQYDYLRRTTEAWTATSNCSAAPTTSTIGGPAKYWHSYSYDLIGNRTKLVRHGVGGAPDVATTYTHPQPGDGASRPHAVTSVTSGSSTVSYQYDATGNMTSRPGPAGTQTLTWNDEGLLASITNGTNTTSYLYDAEGAQLIRRDPGKSTLFLGSGQITIDHTTKAKKGTRVYEGVGVRTGAGFTWTVGDQHGTNTIAIDSANLTVTPRRTDPFGNERGTNPAWPAGDRGFVGGTANTGTGLTRLGAREYDAQLGRFISVDPIIDTADPQQMNPYAYSNNSPATMSDPDGLRYSCPDGDCGGNRGPSKNKKGKKSTPAKAPGTAWNKNYKKYYKKKYHIQTWNSRRCPDGLTPCRNTVRSVRPPKKVAPTICGPGGVFADRSCAQRQPGVNVPKRFINYQRPCTESPIAGLAATCAQKAALENTGRKAAIDKNAAWRPPAARGLDPPGCVEVSASFILGAAVAVCNDGGGKTSFDWKVSVGVQAGVGIAAQQKATVGNNRSQPAYSYIDTGASVGPFGASYEHKYDNDAKWVGAHGEWSGVSRTITITQGFGIGASFFSMGITGSVPMG